MFKKIDKQINKIKLTQKQIQRNKDQADDMLEDKCHLIQ